MTWEWITGFYEGEGSVALTTSGKRGKAKYLCIKIGQKERAILEKIHDFLLNDSGIKSSIWEGINHNKFYNKDYTFCALSINSPSSLTFIYKILPLMQHERKIKQLMDKIALCYGPAKLVSKHSGASLSTSYA